MSINESMQAGASSGNKIHVFHVVNSLQVGGLEQVVVNLINSLNQDLYLHTICCIQQVGPMVSRLKVPVNVYLIGKGAGADYLLPFKIAKIIKKEVPDIIHTRNWSAIDGLIAAIFSRANKLIHDEHGRDAADPNGDNRKRKLIRKILSHWVDRFVPVSKDLEDWYINSLSVPSDKIIRIINGVDTESFIPTRDKKTTRVNLGIDPESFVVGFIGRLDPVKDLVTLVKSFAQFSSLSNLKTCLYIVGKGDEQHLLQNLCNELGISSKVIFAGERSDIATVLQCFDLFALTSIAEGIPMAILESMATGLPVVATAVGGVGEVVTHGITGHLAPAKDVDAIASAFLHYANDSELLARHGANARERAVTEFSLIAMVARYDSLYKSLLAGRGY